MPDTCIKWTLSMNMGASTTLQYEKEESKRSQSVYCISVREESARVLDRLMAVCAAALAVGVEQR